jgi:signal transduction histidine kinase/HPt (histidine-containing phosphotransfer) domain-containing protein
MLDDKNVLIIDDSDTIRAYLQNVLTQRGAIVDGAATGQEGLAICDRQIYDLILLDLFLPDTDGIEVLKAIRVTNDTSTIVMITGYGGIKSAIAAVQLGADGYIEKQDITSTRRDHVEFMYFLDQAMEHRAGLVAQQQLEQIRADFYAMVTHDLRNPTGLILMATDMLLNEIGDSLSSQQRKLVSMIDVAANRLVRLISDYLDFAKIDAGYLRLDFGDVELRQVIESSVRFAELQAQAKQQTLTLDVPLDPVPAWADAERLQQVLDNLLSNAIKYTQEGGQITLRLWVEEGQAVFRVSDTGRGILPEHLTGLFTKYHRVPGAATRGVLGTGLGLLIVKEIAEAHGGSVTVASEGIPGKGATFTVRIPLQPEVPAAPPTSHPAKTGLRPDQAKEGSLAADFAHDPEFRKLFWAETRQHLLILQDALAGLSRASDDQELLDTARHASHTLKGNAGAMQLNVIHELAAQLDGILQQTARDSLGLTPTHLNELAQLLDRIVSIAAREQTS